MAAVASSGYSHRRGTTLGSTQGLCQVHLCLSKSQDFAHFISVANQDSRLALANMSFLGHGFSAKDRHPVFRRLFFRS